MSLERNQYAVVEWSAGCLLATMAVTGPDINRFGVTNVPALSTKAPAFNFQSHALLQPKNDAVRITIPVRHYSWELHPKLRSEERRVGKECDSTCRSRWSPYN